MWEGHGGARGTRTGAGGTQAVTRKQALTSPGSGPVWLATGSPLEGGAASHHFRQTAEAAKISTTMFWLFLILLSFCNEIYGISVILWNHTIVKLISGRLFPCFSLAGLSFVNSLEKCLPDASQGRRGPHHSCMRKRKGWEMEAKFLPCLDF